MAKKKKQKKQAKREQQISAYLAAHPQAALTALRQDPILAAASIRTVLHLDAAARAPERETSPYPVLGPFGGISTTQPLQQTLPKPTPANIRRFTEIPPVRRAMRAIMDPILDMPWAIELRKPMGNRAHATQQEPTATEQRQIEDITAMLHAPNNDMSWRTFLGLILEDLLTFGAGPFEKQRNRSDERPFLLWPVDAQSIRINAGWQEGSDTFRYSQGRGMYYGSLGTPDLVKLRDDELCYMKLNPRASSPFGLGYVEVAFGCYSDDTEVLTKRGWVRWPDATEDDEFATRHPQTDVFEWQKPLQMHKYRWTEDLLHFKSQSTDALVTANHRMFGRKVARVRGRRKRGNATVLYEENRFLRADVVAGLKQPYRGMSAFQVPTRSKWYGNYAAESVVIAAIGGARGKKPEAYEVSMKDWFAFLGIYVAEGSAAGTMGRGKGRRQYHVFVSQAKSSKHREAIRELLWRMPFRWKEIEDGFYCVSKALHTAVFPLGNSYQKYVPQLVKDATPGMIGLFIEWACKGDGSIRPDGLRTYYTASKRLADDMQELFQKYGTTASVSCYAGKGQLPDGRWCESPMPAYYVLEQSSLYDGIGKATPVAYDGFVYCATVPNETLFVRRNGKPLWCGNTINAFVGGFDYAERRASNNTPNFGIFLGENTTLEQARQYQHYWMNEIEGMGKTPILGGGKLPSVFSMQGTGEDQLYLKWQEHCIRIIAMSFGISPMNLALERDVNRSTADAGQDNDWMTIAPVANIIRDYLTFWLLWKQMRITNIEFTWKMRTADELKQAMILAEQYEMNGITVDEIRLIYERPPLDDGLGDMTKTAYEAAISASLTPQPDPELDEDGAPTRRTEPKNVTPFAKEAEANALSPQERAFLERLMRSTRRERHGLAAVAT